MERIDLVTEELFIDNPVDGLCQALAEHIGSITQFKKIFKDEIHSYKKMDFSVRSLPGLRIYNHDYSAESTANWWITGDIIIDILLPANLRRKGTEKIPDILAGAFLQYFRSPKYFGVLCEKIVGLNQLGQRYSADKNLAFEWGENLVPLTQLRVNFRIDIQEWERHLEATARTKDEPFEKTLGNLTKVASAIKGLDDEEVLQVEIDSEQTPGGK